MKHVAQAIGVSIMTVSLALRRAPSIPAATRERVLAAAAKLGYRPNPMVAALMAGLRGRRARNKAVHVIAYVESFPLKRSPQEAAALRDYRQGAAAAAAKHGYRLEIFHLGESGLQEARLEQVLRARGIRGVIFSPFPSPGATLNQSWENHALASIGYSLRKPVLHRAMNHQAHSMQLALAALVDLGYRTIGVAIPRPQNERVERIWLSSVLLAQRDYEGTETRFPLLIFDQGGRPLSTWLRRYRPEVVVTTERELLPVLRRIGRAIQQQVGFVHLHITKDLADWSGVDQNDERIGAAAVDLVLEQLQGNDFGIPKNAKTVLIEGRWLPGKTAPGRKTG